ncbi:MAG: hypothetical protein AAB407_02345 [Patescibacteria group bacterium]
MKHGSKNSIFYSLFSRFFSRKGFTLVEAVVVVGITIILTSILITYSRGSEQQILFFREQALITSAILQAKGFAIETFQPDFQPLFSGTETITPICGWGIHVEDETTNSYPNTIIIFKDHGNPGNNPCASPNPQYNDAQNEKFEVLELDPVIKIARICLNTTITGNCSSPGPASADVVFVPPDPVVKFQPTANANELVIVLETIDGSRTSNISITKGGQVNIE